MIVQLLDLRAARPTSQTLLKQSTGIPFIERVFYRNPHFATGLLSFRPSPIIISTSSQLYLSLFASGGCVPRVPKSYPQVVPFPQQPVLCRHSPQIRYRHPLPTFKQSSAPPSKLTRSKRSRTSSPIPSRLSFRRATPLHRSSPYFKAKWTT
jgi:hypothetical protein